MKSLAKAERLLRLLQTLRRHRYPVLGRDLAEELAISLRTLYRDVAALVAQGANIDGSPGVGYLLRPGFLLPPLMLTQEEVEALVLGSRWVKQRGDPVLQEAAADLLAKVEAVLPSELRQEMASSGLLIGPGGEDTPMPDRDLALIRKAIRTESKLSLCYIDSGDEETRRIVWPFALGWFDHALILAAWCELRQDYRHFRTDRMRTFTVTAERYPRSRRALLQEWQTNRGIPVPGSRKTSASRTADRI
jgi:predicted DNA-binding transcriptional regulator YafY